MKQQAKDSQRGAAHLLLIVALVIALVGVLGFLGYSAWQKQDANAGGSSAVGSKGGTKTTKTLSISPNPLPANKSVQISLSGCGYDASPYTITNVGIQKEGFGSFGYNAGVNPDGCLNTAPFPAVVDANNSFSLPAGTYTVTIKQAINGRVPKNPDAQTTLVVQ